MVNSYSNHKNFRTYVAQVYIVCRCAHLIFYILADSFLQSVAFYGKFFHILVIVLIINNFLGIIKCDGSENLQKIMMYAMSMSGSKAVVYTMPYWKIVTSDGSSVADPNPDPDPHVFGPLGSGSISQRIRILLLSCKYIKKNLDSYYFVTLFFACLSLKIDVNVPSRSNQKKKNFILLAS